ncbi:TPA: hypothetical protein VKH48_001221 [Streptococcus pyogenes]|nr:hypothetical protein [Streptococcus pyogenes]HER3876581.1 hypothetical protein [Streptococcus pyogenes]
MAHTYNFGNIKDVTTFNIGDLTLEFAPSDAKSESLAEKAVELKEKADRFDKSGTEWEQRKELKSLMDEFFTMMFDEDTPQKLYEVCGQNTITYLKLFLMMAEAVQEVNEKKQNDETFKKYLAE